jgi:hypothetical protein
MKTPSGGKTAEALSRLIRNVLDYYQSTGELSLPETWSSILPAKSKKPSPEMAFINTFLKWQGEYTDQGVASALNRYLEQLENYGPKRGRGFPRRDAIVIRQSGGRSARIPAG